MCSPSRFVFFTCLLFAIGKLGRMTSKIRTDRPPSARISKFVERERASSTDACVPIAMVSRAEASRLGLDARALFVFAFVDDRRSVYEILTSSGLPLSDAADAMAQLCESGIIALASSPNVTKCVAEDSHAPRTRIAEP
ncbi:MAG TPA: hypothetical protein VH054_12910 [Polyangiaceae bacterium]|nr:hypothetical protein [Polyangiaceae bacterium]